MVKEWNAQIVFTSFTYECLPYAENTLGTWSYSEKNMQTNMEYSRLKKWINTGNLQKQNCKELIHTSRDGETSPAMKQMELK